MTPEASDTPRRARKARAKPAVSDVGVNPRTGEETSAAGEPLGTVYPTGTQKTLYEVQRQVQDVDVDDSDMTLWRPVARIEAADAKTAAKLYAESLEEFAGGELRVVPVRNITSVTVGVETRRQLTIT